jgi:excisionase family DNA binding protein
VSVTTYSLCEVAQSLNCTTRWLTEQIPSGRFRARKIGRHWRMADSDVVAALDACASDASRAVADADAIPIPTGLTTRSRKRVIGR